VLMSTSFSENLTGEAIRARVRKFYDLGSPLFLEVYGENFHDGYYVTGKESRQEAQENLTRLIAEKARIRQGARVLDVGCGIGGSSFWLAEHLQASTVGITISPAQLEIARKLAADRCADSTFLLMNAEEMHFDETFDVIWAVDSTSHFQSQENFVKSAGAFLKGGGKFAVFDWMAGEAVSDIKNDRYLRPVNEGLLLASLCSINTYLNWFMQSGYRITYTEDITDRTLKTWNDALAIVNAPSILKYASRISKGQITEALRFFKGARAMKIAMEKGYMKSAVIVAEKL
jgi:tocopherol O-methyltransferase